MSCAKISIVQSHEEWYMCPRGECILCGERIAAGNNCVNVLQEPRKNVYENFCGEYGTFSLEALNAFGRYDSLASGAFQVMGLKSFLFRPSSRPCMMGSRLFDSLDGQELIVAGEMNKMSTTDIILVMEEVRTGKKDDWSNNSPQSLSVSTSSSSM